MLHDFRIAIAATLRIPQVLSQVKLHPTTANDKKLGPTICGPITDLTSHMKNKVKLKQLLPELWTRKKTSSIKQCNWVQNYDSKLKEKPNYTALHLW